MKFATGSVALLIWLNVFALAISVSCLSKSRRRVLVL